MCISFIGDSHEKAMAGDLFGTQPWLVFRVRSACIAAAAFCRVPAFAADMAVKAPPPPQPVAAPSWTGFYVGGNLGVVFEYAAGTSNFLDSGGGVAGFSTANPQSNGFNPTSFLGGGQIGYNWQIDPRWVVGVEGDFDHANSRYGACRQTDTFGAPCNENIFAVGFESISSKTDWLSTARGRLGMIATNNMLVYITGGAAWGRVDTTLSQTCLVAGCGSSTVPLAASASSTTTKTGWVAALGGEMQVTGNWFARLEWLHIDLGGISNSLTTAGVSFFVPSAQTTVWSRTEQFDEIRLGVDYRFWGG